MYPCNNPNHQPDGHLVKITADECNVNYEEIIRLHKATYKFFNPTFKEYNEFDEMSKIANSTSLEIANWKEKLCAAWWDSTGIDPRNAVIIERITADGMKIWVERRDFPSCGNDECQCRFHTESWRNGRE
jgi:hypothetical protein